MLGEKGREGGRRTWAGISLPVDEVTLEKLGVVPQGSSVNSGTPQNCSSEKSGWEDAETAGNVGPERAKQWAGAFKQMAFFECALLKFLMFKTLLCVSLIKVLYS